MSCNCNLKLSGLSHWGGTGLINQLEVNLAKRLDWGLLCVGAFTDVNLGMVGAGGDWSMLSPTCDPSRPEAQCWQGIRKGWVWEDITYTDPAGNTHSPLDVVVQVNGTTQTGGYTVDYPNGIVCFDAAIATDSSVSASYSFRCVQTYIADSTPWWQQVQRGSLSTDFSEFKKDGCGAWSIGAHHRIQLPAIIVGVSAGSETKRGLTGCCRRITHYVNYHVIAENRGEGNDLIDMLLCQGDRGICTFDVDAAALAGNLLTCEGDKTSDTLNYGELATQHPGPAVKLGGPVSLYTNTLDCTLYESVVATPAVMCKCD